MNDLTYIKGATSHHKISICSKSKLDLSPKAIINKLNLINPIYKKTSVYGHFGRNENEFTWEKVDKKLFDI